MAHENNRFNLSGVLEGGGVRQFRRPDKGVSGVLSRLLPPLPGFVPVWYPTPAVLRRLPSYRLAAFGLLVGAVTLLIMLVLTIPWMRISPATLVFTATGHLFGDLWGTIAGVPIIILLIAMVSEAGGTTILHYKAHGVKFWDGAAMYEEQWFRTGAEKWSPGQRVYSTIAFGAVHVVNIIYPIGSLIVVTLVGGVFMACYLRVYRRTGDTQAATLSSAKLHATYNRFAIVYMAVALLIVVVTIFI